MCGVTKKKKKTRKKGSWRAHLSSKWLRWVSKEILRDRERRQQKWWVFSLWRDNRRESRNACSLNTLHLALLSYRVKTNLGLHSTWGLCVNHKCWSTFFQVKTLLLPSLKVFDKLVSYNSLFHWTLKPTPAMRNVPTSILQLLFSVMILIHSIISNLISIYCWFLKKELLNDGTLLHDLVKNLEWWDEDKAFLVC